MRTAPNYRIGTSKRIDVSATSSTKGIVTEPGGYDPKSSLIKLKAPDYRFGSSKRRMYDDKVSKTIPAPGHYNIAKGAFGKKGVLMGCKLKSMTSLNSPGAGTYEPDFSQAKVKPPQFSMGIKLKIDFSSTLKVPGPGTYVNEGEKLKQAAPKFGFGSSKRPEIGGSTKLITPGPGKYKLPSKISNVPDFAMPGRSQEHKFI